MGKTTGIRAENHPVIVSTGDKTADLQRGAVQGHGHISVHVPQGSLDCRRKHRIVTGVGDTINGVSLVGAVIEAHFEDITIGHGARHIGHIPAVRATGGNGMGETGGVRLEDQAVSHSGVSKAGNDDIATGDSGCRRGVTGQRLQLRLDIRSQLS